MQEAKASELSGSQGSGSGSEAQTMAPEQASLQKIKDLLKTKDDTSRFVGLALLKSVLDNTPELQQDGIVIRQLWGFIPGKFLDRLLRSGSSPSPSPNSKNMLDLAVAVIHAFTLLLPEESKSDEKLVARIPMLCNAILQSSENTTVLILQALLTLVSHPQGAQTLAQIEDLSNLVEIAPTQPLVLNVLSFAFLGSMATANTIEARSAFAHKVEQVLADLVRSYTGTDGVTLLDFLADFLRRLDDHFLPSNPPWLSTLVGYIRNLTSSRPTHAARSAYVNLAATLVHVYPIQAPNLLFADAKGDSEKPFSYMFINLLLIDLRASFPALLEQLNSPGYQNTARRLASDFDVVSCYIGFLMRSLIGDDLDEGPQTHLSIPPDLLLKLRKAMSETMSVTIEFLRDRWDASVAGAMGLHPDARAGEAKTSKGSRLTIAWDSMKAKVGEDILVLSAIRCLAIWLREDDNELLRKEAMGLLDMFLDLYKISSLGGLDFRRPVLVALEGIMTLEEAPEALLSQDGWKVLTGDLLSIPSSGGTDDDFSRGTDIVRIMLPIAENERPGSREEWLDLTTAVAAWNVLGKQLPTAALEFYVAALQLVTSILANAHPSIQRRYKHTVNAISGLATQLRCQSGRKHDDLSESLQDVLDTIAAMG
ncbi:hypothetical protein MCOR02_005760 [Pyricularia oryzae]|nr:hypothetical protein MCOR02_005760 [Pyricularia oryzae]KAI6408773.1 hypothetical protein MCOR23_001170 [Pyricularia oryzae]KAI6453219.1 hypothetical protein MCOR22_000563 [Pyricularia oryzae]KAI6508482.1 hypothetical protein MCOR13_002225 [Pyricularia oryzae]KAI6523848.1 hypothetical protein MCOR10_005118 [Pyricularia oryzae]